MPGLDGTGPRGMGPMTGGGRGFCAAYLPASPGWGPAAYAPMYRQPMMAPGFGAWGGPYSPFAPPYAVPYGGLGAYSFRPFGMGMGWGMGRGFGMGTGRGMGRGRWW